MTGPAAGPARTSIRALDAAEAKARLGELSDILVDAVNGERLVATVMVTVAHQPNAPHRAEIGKMLVVSSARLQAGRAPRRDHLVLQEARLMPPPSRCDSIRRGP